ARLEAALDVELARRSQIPHDFSAIHVQGKRAHELARKGEPVDLEPRDVTMIALSLVNATAEPPSVTLRLAVSKGYYVRSLARDLAATLGTVAHLTMLRRLRSGPFSIDEAVTLDDPNFASRILSVTAAALRSLPHVILDEAQTRDAGHGKTVHFTNIDMRGDCAWLDGQGNLIAVGTIGEDGAGRVQRGFNLTK
ncbi:MAG: tRNA pseudouridine synthase B, partial [Polyangiaceae bacterium]